MKSTLKTDPKALLAFFEHHLLNEIMPFWTENCIDWEHGGISNLVRDDGIRLSDEKYMWSQGRGLYTYSALYNHISRNPEYLKIADCIADCIARFRRPDGTWCFRMSCDGEVVDQTRSIYVDAYICDGLTEYAIASGKQEYLDMALEIYERASQQLDDPRTLPVAPLFFPSGMQPHAPTMHCIFSFELLGQATKRKDILDRTLALTERVMNQHIDPKNHLLYEFVLPGGGRAPNEYGQTVVPGHSIEAMWFYEEVYNTRGMDKRVQDVLNSLRAHVTFGWDETYGGIFLAKHVQPDCEPKWHNAESKSWWPQCETMYALLRAYERTGEMWYADWFDKLFGYIFTHYPCKEHGEWYHCLDRRGNLRDQIATIPVKDPYHLPRALIKCILSLKRLVEKEGL